MKTLIGTLHCLIALTEEDLCEHCLDFVLTTGEIITNVSAPPDCPLEVLIEAIFDGNRIVDWSVLQLVAEQALPVRVAMIAVSKTDSGVDTMRTRLERDAGKIEAATRYLTDIDCVFDLHAIKVDNDPHISSSMFWQEVQQKVGQYHKYWVWGGSRSGFCGHAYLSSSRAITYSNCFWPTMAHEGPGHTGIAVRTGLNHSGAGTNHYGENTFMGHASSRWNARGWNMPMLESINQVPIETIHIVGEGESKQLHLIAPTTDESVVHNGLWKGIAINKAFTRKYRVSYWPADNTIRIHRPDPENSSTWRKTWMLSRLEVGQRYDNDIHVEFVDFSNGIAKVNVSWDTAPSAIEEKAWPSKSIEVDQPIDSSKIGLWHSDRHSYQGLDIHIDTHNDNVVGFWYTYNDDGTPQWYLFEGAVANNVADLTFYKAEGNSINHVGTGCLYFLDDNTGMFKYFIDNRHIGRDGFVIERISTRAESDLYGVWDIEGREHEGLSITVNEQRELDEEGEVQVYHTVQAFWYKNTGGDWWFIEGILGEELQVYRPHDGFYKLDVSRNVLLKDGTCRLEPGKLTYKGQEFTLNPLL